MILDALIRDGNQLASYATVSRYWQAIIEPGIFKRIRVTPSRIPELDQMTRRNRHHVKFLWICLELERYGCDACSPDDDDDYSVLLFNSPADDIAVKIAIQSLFLVLGEWDSTSSLTLDISVYSTSDPEHWFKYLTIEPDEDEEGEQGEGKGRKKEAASPNKGCARITQTNQADLGEANDARHQWDTSFQNVNKAQTAVLKVFTRTLGNPSGEVTDDETDGYGWLRDLPLVPAVTRLLLRLQTRRRWDPNALVEMLGRLPRLRDLHYEPWREWDDMLQRVIDQGEIRPPLCGLLDDSLTSRLSTKFGVY